MHFVMVQRMVHGIQERATGQPLVPASVLTLARVGWLLAGLGVFALLASRRGWWPWLALTVIILAPALSSTGDWDAALAGFLAIGNHPERRAGGRRTSSLGLRCFLCSSWRQTPGRPLACCSTFWRSPYWQARCCALRSGSRRLQYRLECASGGRAYCADSSSASAVTLPVSNTLLQRESSSPRRESLLPKGHSATQEASIARLESTLRRPTVSDGVRRCRNRCSYVWRVGLMGPTTQGTPPWHSSQPSSTTRASAHQKRGAYSSRRSSGCPRGACNGRVQGGRKPLQERSHAASAGQVAMAGTSLSRSSERTERGTTTNE